MVAALGLLPLALGPAAPLEAQSATLPLIGRSDLGGAGFNSAVAIVGTTAIIGAGIVPTAGIHAQLYAPLPCPAVSVKVVSLADPVRPKVVAQIPMPEGVVAQDVSALRVRTPAFTGDLAAIALAICNSMGAGIERGVVYYDVTNPSKPRYLAGTRPTASASRPRCSPASRRRPGTTRRAPLRSTPSSSCSGPTDAFYRFRRSPTRPPRRIRWATCA